MTESLADTLAGVCFLILMVLIVVWDYRIRQRRKGVKSRQEWEAERALRGVPRRA